MARRQVILSAARACFLQFGYAKTSLEDIARRANLSRPLLYRKFKNKEEIFSAVYEELLESGYPAAEAVMAGPGSKRDKLIGLYEATLLPIWSQLLAMPMAAELFEACEKLFPEVEARHRRIWIKHLAQLLGSKELAEVFHLAVEGCEGDMPTTPVLRKRIHLLAAQFV